MRRGIRTGITAVAVVLYLLVAADLRSIGHAKSQSPPEPTLISQYCLGCHSDRLKSGGLALSTLNLEAPGQSAEVAEKVIRKLRGGLMPPPGAKRPDAHATAEFVSWLENKVDAASVQTKPGRVPLRRLNRREDGHPHPDAPG